MRIVALVFCALTILACERVSADSSLFAPYEQQPFPDLVSTSGDVIYDAGADTLSITAYADKITYSLGIFEEIFMGLNDFGDFSLDAVISAGAELDGESVTGTLQIDGQTTTYNSTGVLLKGDLFAFRSTGGDQMEFLYRVTGGDLSGLYGGLDAVGSVVLGATGFLGDFDSDFDNFDGMGPGFGTAVADAFATTVPEPGSFVLAAFGVVGLLVGARFRRNSLHAARTVRQPVA